jgi:hypothetical protein
MKRFIAIAAALAAILVLSNGQAQAQTLLHPGGFPYPGTNSCGGGGFGAFGGFGALGLQVDREQPPYFAKFPPVYYSHAVKRPYGISPFAAPAGVVPVEMSHSMPAVEPVVIENPHVKQGAAEIKVDTKDEMTEKTASFAKEEKVVGWRQNPFFNANEFVLK